MNPDQLSLLIRIFNREPFIGSIEDLKWLETQGLVECKLFTITEVIYG